MARRFEFYTQVGDGANAVTVGYSSKQRGKSLAVTFVGPDEKRLEKITACKRIDQNYHLEAAKIIAKAYAPLYPDTRRVGWDEALDAVEKAAADLRPATLRDYRQAVQVFRQTLDAEKVKPAGPGVITPQLASLFARQWLADVNAKRKRKPVTLAFYLRQLSAVWGQFLNLGFAKENPWKSVRKPQTDKVRKAVPTEAEVTVFFAWIKEKYPAWERLYALLELKAISGCRSMDVYSLRSNQLVNGRVVWTAEQTKHREGRAVLVPNTLFQQLQRLAGKTWLWEGMIADREKYRPNRKQIAKTFSPETLRNTVRHIFEQFADEHPDKKHLTPHAFRRRAITLMVTATQSVDATAEAIGLHPATARAYYLDARRAFDTDEVFRKLAGILIPQGAPTIPLLNPTNAAQNGTNTNKDERKKP